MFCSFFQIGAGASIAVFCMCKKQKATKRNLQTKEFKEKETEGELVQVVADDGTVSEHVSISSPAQSTSSISTVPEQATASVQTEVK